MTPSSDKTKKYIIIALLIIICLVAYGRILGNDFVNIDDPVYVTENRNIQSGITLEGFHWAFSTTYAQFWHPLTWLSLMFDYQLYGLKPGGYHLTNLLLHIMSALLLFWLFNRMTGTIWRSAFIAALFALHPLHVESVAWIAERKDVLSAFFWMLTFCLYVYYTEKPATKRYLLVLLCFACGLMSKSMIVTLPIVMILLDYWPLGRLGSRKAEPHLPDPMPGRSEKRQQKTRLKKGAQQKNVSPTNIQKVTEKKIAGIIPLWQLQEKIPFFIVSAAFTIITLYAQYKPDFKGFSLSSRIANAPVSFVTYLGKTFWPYDLAVFYPFSDQLPVWQVLGAALLILIISAAVIVTVKRLPYLFVGWFWYAITLLPVIGIVQVGKHAMADRYTYIPLIGISIMLVWGIPLLIKREEIRKTILFPVGVICIAILSFLTWQQCGYWKNSTILFNHALQVTKENYMAHTNLGVALAAERKNEEAIEHYEAALRIKYNDDTVHYNLGNVLYRLGRTEETLHHYQEAVRINPNYSKAHNNLGLILTNQNKYEEAIYHYRQALRINPGDPGFYLNLGVAQARKGEWQEAIDQFRTAIAINPAYEEARRVLRLTLEQGKIHGAK